MVINMGQVQILADSCCDLEKEHIKKYNIGIIPLYVLMGEKAYKDGLEITPEILYEYFEQTHETPKTSAANVEDYIEFFKPYIEEGKSIVYIGISAEMSSTMENAKAAAASFPDAEIHIVDSRNLSTGIGLLVLKACELSKDGRSAVEIAKKIEALTKLSRASFVIDTLEYLRRGGRCSMIAALGASILSIKPEIAVRNGSMSNRSKFIGTILPVAKKYAGNLLYDIEKIDNRRVFITYTKNTDEAVINAVYDTVNEREYFKEIIKTTAGCVITSHCGRNTIGLLFMDKEEA
jgi:DegV family protein with EDD domain